MPKQYIAIKAYDGWGKGESAKEALSELFDGKKNVKRITDDDLRSVRLIEVTYPVNDDDSNDVIFYPDATYELRGDTIADHYDGPAILKKFGGEL